MSEELKACPLCGSDDLEVINSSLSYVACNNCHCFGPDRHSKTEATEAWNTRAGEKA